MREPEPDTEFEARARRLWERLEFFALIRDPDEVKVLSMAEIIHHLEGAARHSALEAERHVRLTRPEAAITALGESTERFITSTVRVDAHLADVAWWLRRLGLGALGVLLVLLGLGGGAGAYWWLR